MCPKIFRDNGLFHFFPYKGGGWTSPGGNEIIFSTVPTKNEFKISRGFVPNKKKTKFSHNFSVVSIINVDGFF